MKRRKYVYLALFCLLLGSYIHAQTDPWQPNIPVEALYPYWEGVRSANNGLTDEAIDMFKESLSIRYDFYSAQLGLATIKSYDYADGRAAFDETLQEFQTAERIASEHQIPDPKLYSNMAWLYFIKALNTSALFIKEREQAFWKAESLLDRSLDIDPKNAEALNTKGAIYELKGEWDQALYYYNQATDLGFEKAEFNSYRMLKKQF